jgi:RHS repeat-associated protein
MVATLEKMSPKNFPATRQETRTATISGSVGYDYTAFGESYAPNTSITIDQRYTYTGREKNPVSDSMYYRTRPYSTNLGRMLNRSLWGYIQGRMSLYDAMACNPVLFREPFSTVQATDEVFVDVDVPGVYDSSVTTNFSVTGINDNGGGTADLIQSEIWNNVAPYSANEGVTGEPVLQQ